MYVGRIQPLKGLELAIRALDELLPALGGEVCLVVVGGASGRRGVQERERLGRLVDTLGLARRVRWLGPQPHDRLPVYYRAADALVVCSHSESFGLAALEAHACGTPVVGTAVGGLSHIVGDNSSGFLVDSRDPSVFAARLKTLLSDAGLWRAFSDRARLAAAPFSWQKTARSFLELYECLVREDFPEACIC